MVVTSTLMSGFSASKRLTASCWYCDRPDSVCWLSQNFSTVWSACAALAMSQKPVAASAAERIIRLDIFIPSLR